MSDFADRVPHKQILYIMCPSLRPTLRSPASLALACVRIGLPVADMSPFLMERTATWSGAFLQPGRYCVLSSGLTCGLGAQKPLKPPVIKQHILKSDERQPPSSWGRLAWAPSSILRDTGKSMPTLPGRLGIWHRGIMRALSEVARTRVLSPKLAL